jgi:hypothetical protein
LKLLHFRIQARQYPCLHTVITAADLRSVRFSRHIGHDFPCKAGNIALPANFAILSGDRRCLEDEGAVEDGNGGMTGDRDCSVKSGSWKSRVLMNRDGFQIDNRLMSVWVDSVRDFLFQNEERA